MPDRGVSAVKNEGARVLDIVRSGCVRHGRRLLFAQGEFFLRSVFIRKFKNAPTLCIPAAEL